MTTMMNRLVGGFKKCSQCTLKVGLAIHSASFASAANRSSVRKFNKIGDMHTSTIIDELNIDQFLQNEKKTMVEDIKNRYINWNSEFNIKKKLKTYKQENVVAMIPEMMMKLQEFYSKNELENASSIVIPPFIKEHKNDHVPTFTTSQLHSIQKDLRYVGYSLSYLDDIPKVLQTRIIRTKDVLYAQMSIGIRAIEDIYGWTNRGKRVQLKTEFPLELPTLGGIDLPLDSKTSEWKTAEDAEHQKYVYNSNTKESLWSNPDEYTNRRKYRAYLCVIERPIMASMGSWRFHKL